MIAACEWIFGGRPLAEVLALLARAGYDGIEVSGEPGRADRDTLAETLAAHGLRASGTTAVCNWPTNERDLASPDAEVRRRAVAYYRGCVDLAVAVGAPVVGLIPAAVGRLDALSERASERRAAVEGAREVAHYAGERDVAVAVEAINRYETYLVRTVDEALAFADDVAVPGVGVIADTFHMQLEEESSAAAVERAGGRLAALHLADSNRLGLGRGQLELAPVLEAARATGFGGPYVMEFTAPGPNPFRSDKGPEAMRDLDGYVAESRERLRALASV